MNKETAIKNINEFVKQRDYTYSVKEMLDFYVKYYKNGYYIPFTMKDCVKHLKDELEYLVTV